jgi:diguanylate cyclase (GGDEF)-like protein/PAS domain S-box-containing protein
MPGKPTYEELERRVLELEKADFRRKQAEASLRLKNLVFDVSIAANSIADINGIIHEVNNSFLHIWGYPGKDGVIGKPIQHFLNSQDDVIAILTTLNKSGKWDGEYTAKRRDGTTFIAHGMATVLKNENGKVAGYQSAVMDITERKRTDEAVRLSQAQLLATLDNTPDVAIQWYDEHGRILYWNMASEVIYGWKSDEAIGKTLDALILTPKDAACFQNILNEIRETGKPSGLYEIQIRRRGGASGWVQSTTFGMPMREGRTGFVCMDVDITERKRAEKALRESEDKYRRLIETTDTGFVIIDEHGRVLDANQEYVGLTGRTEFGEVAGHSILEWTAPHHLAHNKAAVARCLAQGFVRNLALDYVTPVGQLIPIEVNATALPTPDGVHILSLCRDITDRKQAEEALKESEERYRELSIIDDLTQLYNSRHLYNQLKMEIDRVNRYKEPMSIILLDLDNFKDFNDAYGHIEGDQVLMRLGQVIKRCLRKTDSAYRYGGEEFIILLPMTICEDAVLTAERVKTEFRKENFSPVSDKAIHMTLSFGVGHYKPQEEMKVFVHRVDQLMYQAKKRGKDRVCY